MIRVGQGFDVHQFGGDKVLRLGGIEFPGEQGLLAHSDGDVLTHALCDAILGAINQGDIGHLFPDTDPSFAGVDSQKLLETVCQRLAASNYLLMNADITVMAQKPKMAPYISAIKERLARTMQVDIEQISVKATTTEKLGFVGRKEGIAVSAVVLVADRMLSGLLKQHGS